MNLLEKAKVITTPTAYSGGILHSVKPINGDADFTFTRSSSATRVGEDGYIQNVPTTEELGGELVQNGDFEEIGSELVTNGSFDTDSDWTLASGATISNSVLNFNQVAAGDGAYQPSTLTSLTVRKVVVVCSEYTSGSMQVRVGTTSNPERIVGVGTYTYYLRYAGYDYVNLFINAEFTGVISSVSVKEVGQNWEFGYGWNIEDDGGNLKAISGTNTSRLISDATLVSGKKYQFSLSTSSGSASNYRVALKFNGTNTNIGVVHSDGSHEFIVQADSTSFRLQTVSTTTTSFLVDNISVKEITDVSNLPRINYEGFDYDNGLPIYGSGKGHLLLEGQSTNNLSYSENFATNWVTYLSTISTDNSILSPDGETNGTLVSKNGQQFARIEKGSLALASSTYTFSVFAKKGLTNWVKLRTDGIAAAEVSFDLENGVVGTNAGATSASIEDYGNGWYRCSISFTASITICRLYVADVDNGWGNTNAASAYFWGAMIEEGDISSYIPTNGSAVTRTAETCNNAGNADLFDSEEGVLYAEIAANSINSNSSISLNNGNSDFIRFVLFGGTRINVGVTVGGVSQVNINKFSFNYTIDNKIAFKYKENDFALWVNGVEIATDNSGVTPSLNTITRISFSRDGGSIWPFYGKIRMVAVFPYLSNDEMECLTSI